MTLISLHELCLVRKKTNFIGPSLFKRYLWMITGNTHSSFLVFFCLKRLDCCVYELARATWKNHRNFMGSGQTGDSAGDGRDRWYSRQHIFFGHYKGDDEWRRGVDRERFPEPDSLSSQRIHTVVPLLYSSKTERLSPLTNLLCQGPVKKYRAHSKGRILWFWSNTSECLLFSCKAVIIIFWGNRHVSFFHILHIKFQWK